MSGDVGRCDICENYKIEIVLVCFDRVSCLKLCELQLCSILLLWGAWVVRLVLSCVLSHESCVSCVALSCCVTIVSKCDVGLSEKGVRWVGANIKSSCRSFEIRVGMQDYGDEMKRIQASQVIICLIICLAGDYLSVSRAPAKQERQKGWRR